MDQPEYEFGTNTGRQGTFNPRDPKQSAMAMKRLQELQTQWGPRLDPNYSGQTGYSDLGTYSQNLNARTEAQNIQRVMGGSSPLNVKFGGVTSSPALAGLRQSNPFAKRYRSK